MEHGPGDLQADLGALALRQTAANAERGRNGRELRSASLSRCGGCRASAAGPARGRAATAALYLALAELDFPGLE
jgi:hypothetical protein